MVLIPISPGRARARAPRVLTVALSALAVLAPAAAAAPTAAAVHACAQARPGHARCLELIRATPRGRRQILPAHLIRADARARLRGALANVDPGPPPHGYAPATLHSAYSLPTTAGGTPPTIAVVDAYDDPAIEDDLGVYDQMFGLPACTTANGCLTKLNQLGLAGPYPQQNADWDGEIALDVETVHAICQNCPIMLVEATSTSTTNLGVAEGAAIAAGATIVSNSFGIDENGIDYQSFNHPGAVIVASSGDDGYGAQYPASSPHVVAVGGTSLDVNGAGLYLGEQTWTGGGSGCSAFFAAPAWQSAAAGFAAAGCDGKRAIADVAADGDPQTGIAMYDSVADQGQPGGWMVAGGTSLSAPLIAGVYGLAGGSGAVAYPAQTLYARAADTPGALHDVTSGANGTCGGLTICAAAAGYDGPTGVGTPNGIAAFVVHATTTPPPATTATTPTPPPVTTAAPVTPVPGAAPPYSPTAAATVAAHAKAVAQAQAQAAAHARVKARAKARALALARARARARARAKRARALAHARAQRHKRR